MSIQASESDAQEVANMFAALSGNLSFKNLNATILENIELKAQIENLESAYKANTRLLVEAQDSLQSARQDASGKSARLEAKDKERTALKAGLDTARVDYETAKKKLDQANRELKILRGFAITLKPASSEVYVPFEHPPIPSFSLGHPVTHLRSKPRLRALFTGAQKFAELYFGADFPNIVLEDTPLWDGIITAHKIDQLPFPLSNAVPAKQMRVAAVLSILSDIFSLYLFQPVFLKNQDRGLSEHMNVLANENDEQESYLRSVLLNGIPQPDQEIAMQHCIKSAMEQISKWLDTVFKTKEEKDKVSAALHELCSSACSHWQHVQHVTGKIEPNFEYDDVDQRDWEPLSFKSPSVSDQPHASPIQKPQPNGNPSTSNSGAAKAKNKPPLKTGQSDMSSMSDKVVWPSFIIVSSDDQTPEVLVPGYVLQTSHLQAALEETTRLTLARRRKSKSARRNTMTGSAVGGEERSPKDSNGSNKGDSFLSSKGGGGLKTG